MLREHGMFGPQVRHSGLEVRHRRDRPAKRGTAEAAALGAGTVGVDAAGIPYPEDTAFESLVPKIDGVRSVREGGRTMQQPTELGVRSARDEC